MYKESATIASMLVSFKQSLSAVTTCCPFYQRPGHLGPHQTSSFTNCIILYLLNDSNSDPDK